MKKRILFIFTGLILSLFMGIISINRTYAIKETGLSVNNPDKTSQELKVLVIEINPLLNTIVDNQLYSNNGGHPKVSEYFGQDEDIPLNEMIKDIEDSSHNYFDVTIVEREWLNEFPTYTSSFNLVNGTGYRFDEETYLQYAGYDGSSSGSWWNLIYNNIFDVPQSYSFDYEYILNKYDLVNRRNNGEFDQVWLLSIDPSQTFETNMVGRSAFWVNGQAFIKECDNFLMFNISISRRDANFHALGHGMEGIMNNLYGYSQVSSYISSTGIGYDVVDIDSVDSYSQLNLWDKFALNDYSNASNYSSVGNVHFTFNSQSSYDYSNLENRYTNWRDWLNYPNVEGNFVLDNSDAWMNYPMNTSLDSDQNKDPDRLYMRFWFSLMPHIEGYTSDGYLNNWWKYLYSLDYVDRVSINGSELITVDVGDTIDVDYTVHYDSDKEDRIYQVKERDNVHISNPSVLGYRSGILYAKNSGESDVTIYHDGKGITYGVTVDVDLSSINIPTAEDYCQTNLIYNGNNQLLTRSPGIGYTFSNNVKRDAGEYTITATLNSGNMWNDGTTEVKTFKCSITKKKLNPEISSCDSRIYSGTTDVACAISIATGILLNDTVNIDFASNGKCSFDNKNVGNNKTVTCGTIILTGDDAVNYELTNAILTTQANITKAPLTIKVNDTTLSSNENVISYETTMDGFMNHETPDVLTGTLVYTIKNSKGDIVTINNNTPSGVYTIIPSGLSSSNYNITYISGTLTIEEVITGNIIFDANGGIGEMMYIEAASSINLPACTYKRNGYEFKGWSKTKNGSVVYTNSQRNITDLKAETTLYAVWQENADEKVTFNEDNMSRVNEKLNLTDYINNLGLQNNYTVQVIKKDGTTLGNSEKVGTGSITKILKDNKLYATKINIVKGDVTGDGNVNIADVKKIADYSLTKSGLEYFDIYAAEVTGNNTINVADIRKIADHSLNKTVDLWS